MSATEKEKKISTLAMALSLALALLTVAHFTRKLSQNSSTNQRGADYAWEGRGLFQLAQRTLVYNLKQIDDSMQARDDTIMIRDR